MALDPNWFGKECGRLLVIPTILVKVTAHWKSDSSAAAIEKHPIVL